MGERRDCCAKKPPSIVLVSKRGDGVRAYSGSVMLFMSSVARANGRSARCLQRLHNATASVVYSSSPFLRAAAPLGHILQWRLLRRFHRPKSFPWPFEAAVPKYVRFFFFLKVFTAHICCTASCLGLKSLVGVFTMLLLRRWGVNARVDMVQNAGINLPYMRGNARSLPELDV